MSGAAFSSHASRLDKRPLTPLTLKVAIFIRLAFMCGWGVHTASFARRICRTRTPSGCRTFFNTLAESGRAASGEWNAEAHIGINRIERQLSILVGLSAADRQIPTGRLAEPLSWLNCATSGSEQDHLLGHSELAKSHRC